MNTFELACDDFERLREEDQAARYLLHFPRKSTAYLGLGCRKIISYGRSGFRVESPGGCQQMPAVANPLAAMQGLLDADRPSFWLVSPDLCRPVEDAELPLIVCVQPEFEVCMAGTGDVDEPAPKSLPAAAEGWQTQSDAEFVARLARSIEILQGYPEGKMIVTRAYQRPTGGHDPFRLFRLFAGTEGAAACNHFFSLADGICSLGCSPENVFEIADGRLAFDVVAGTRGISVDPATDARWLAALKNDPKERREHLLAFNRYRARIETLIAPGSLAIEQQLEVLRLGNVRHLYSRMSGEIRHGLDWSQLLVASFPALTSYPEAVQRQAEDAGAAFRFYGGIVGRVAPGGRDAAFFLNLRAALVKRDQLFTQGGVGVIAESQPDKELLEVNNKLSGLMKAIAAWEQGG